VFLEREGSAESDSPPLRLQFPVGTPWSELQQGNFIFSVIFEMAYKEYVIFGDSASWALLALTEHAWPEPVNLLACLPSVDSTFAASFSLLEAEQSALYSDLTDHYRGIVVPW
jgi:hypothetical protein